MNGFSNKVPMLAFIAIMTVLSGCATIGGTYDLDKLKETVAYETQCPTDKISVIRMKDDGMAGTGRFELDACGKKVNYVRMGMSYFEQSKAANMAEKK